MKSHDKVAGTVDAWESGELGRSAEHAVRASKELEKEVDEALGMQAISIRLEKELIKSFKMIADYHGVGYQPLMRDALKRFADAEFKIIAIKAINEQKGRKETLTKTEPEPPEHKRAA